MSFFKNYDKCFDKYIHYIFRIYCNWFHPKLEGVRPRIASRVTPSLRSDQPGIENMLDMIEFPHRDSPLQITVCPSTGNFMVAAVNVLVIYKYTLKVQEMSKTKLLSEKRTLI